VNTIRLSREFPSVEVLHETDEFLALNKPAGLLAVPDRFDKARPNLMALLQAARPDEWLANVHRLDFNTSGVLVIARNRDAFRALTRQFRNRETRKTYAAIVRGMLETSPLTIDLLIGPHPKFPGLARVDLAHGSEARSIVTVREKFRGFTLLEVVIETGRLHQIRVHLQAIGCPVVGDPDYGGAPLFLSQLKRKYKAKEEEEERPLLDRPALHAEQLTLIRPREGKPPGEPLTITAPWPKDLTVALKYLRRFAAGYSRP